VAVFIRLKEGQNLSEEDVTDFCRGKIARFKTPKYIFFVKEFPMTASGKIQKFKLSRLGEQWCRERGIEVK